MYIICCIAGTIASILHVLTYLIISIIVQGCSTPLHVISEDLRQAELK